MTEAWFWVIMVCVLVFAVGMATYLYKYVEAR